MKYCSEIIAHEVAHQWFGNLVTLQDWTDLWLNEAGATFLSWICCDHFYPEWKVWDSFVGGSMQLGLNLDALKSTHPIHYSSCTQDQIAQMFDDISYDKGAALLRMVTKWVGKESLINGLCSYLKEFQWKNATSKDLWSHIEKASGKPVLDVMNAWTEKPGYPKVSVTELAQEGSEVTLELTQKRFFKAQQKDLDSTEIYPIILFIKSGDEVVHKIFDTEKMILKVKRDSATNLYNLNVDHAGFYIINYKDHFQTLFDSSMHMSNQDKIGLISDVVALATTGDVNVTFLIDAIKKWASEGIESGAYWKQLISAMDSVEHVFDDVNVSKLFTTLVEDKLDEVGIEIKFTESTSQHEAKAALFECAVSHKSCKYFKIACEMYSKFVSDKVGIKPLFRVAVFTSAALTANLKSGRDLLETFEELGENSPSALKALGRFTDTPMIKEILYWIYDQLYHTSESSVILEVMSSKNPQGRKMIWEWFTKHWNTIIKMYPTDLKPFQHIMRPCTNGFSTHDDYLMVKDFFRYKDTKGFDMILAQNLETIKYRYEWHVRDAELLNSYFST